MLAAAKHARAERNRAILRRLALWPMLPEDDLIHPNRHAADCWDPWSRGPDAARRVRAQMARIGRHQREREAYELGYHELGGEAGGA